MNELKFKKWYVLAFALSGLNFFMAFLFSYSVGSLLYIALALLLLATPLLDRSRRPSAKVIPSSKITKEVPVKPKKARKIRWSLSKLKMSTSLYALAFITILYMFLGSFYNNVAIFLVGVSLFFFSSVSLLDVLLKRQAIGPVKADRKVQRSKVFAGETVKVGAEISSGRYPLDVVEMVDSHAEAMVGEPIFLNPGPTNLDYTFKCNLRGRYNLGPLSFTARDRLGYFSEEIQLAGEKEVTVYPPYETIHKMEISRKGRHLGKLYGVHQTRQIGMGTELHGIRKYVPTDEYRRIAWKHFARHSTLMSKEFEGEKNVTVMVCVDSCKAMGIGERPNTKLEYAIQAAMMLCKMADERGDSFGVVVFSNGVKHYLRPGRGKVQYTKLLETLTDVQGEGTTSFTKLADFVCNYIRRTTLTIVLSDFEGNLDDISWGIRKMRARGHHILGICPYTPYFDVPTLKDPALAAVSEALLKKMKRKHLRQIKYELGKLGVDTIDVGPRDFLPIVAAKFLEKKKLGAALL